MSSFDPLVEAVAQRLDLIHVKAEALVKSWFPNMPEGPDKRITVLAVMKQLVALMQLEAGVPAPTAAVAPSIPRLDLAEIDELVWTTYKTKERAKLGEAAWTFSDPERHGDPEYKRVVAELVKAIKASKDEKLELGDMLYMFSGKEKQFISRRPVKKSNPDSHKRMEQNLHNIHRAAKRMGLKNECTK